MKKVKRSAFVLCAMAAAATGLWACSNSDELQASENNTASTYAQRKGVKIPDYVIQDVNYSMVSFVDSLRDYYKPGMSYGEFKKALDPDTGLAKIKKEADVLLHTAYDNLRYNVKEDKMNGVPMLEFLVFIMEDNMNKGVKDIRTLDFDKEAMLSFGIEETDRIMMKKCKWYQIGCHLGDTLSWLTDSGNSHEPIDMEVLIEIIRQIIAIIFS